MAKMGMPLVVCALVGTTTVVVGLGGGGGGSSLGQSSFSCHLRWWSQNGSRWTGNNAILRLLFDSTLVH